MTCDNIKFDAVQHELKIFNDNFYAIAASSPSDWEDWSYSCDESISYPALKTSFSQSYI